MAEVNIKSKVGLYDIPLDVWEHIFKCLPSKDVSALSCVCKRFQRNVQSLVKEFDFSHCYSLSFNRLLNYTLSATCVGINLNYCYWLKASKILEIISKTTNHLQHLHLIECDVNEECIESILLSSSNLQLTSLSFTFSQRWKSTLIKLKNENINNIRAFQHLKRLEIFYKDFPSGILIEIYLLVLKHCQALETLKIFECISRSFEKDPSEKYPLQLFRITPTPVPKLISLTINVQTLQYDQNVTNLIALIMKQKVAPLQSVDFGSQNAYLYKRNMLSEPRIVFDKSTLSINCGKGTDLNFWLNYEPAQNLIRQKNYKKIIVKDVELAGFQEFARLMVSNSQETLKEFHLKHRRQFKNCDVEYWDSLAHIAINCHQITVFDISGHHFESFQSFIFISNASVRKNKLVLNALTHLKNLEKLCMSPKILHCRYFKSNGKQCVKAMPFWAVTSACKKLIEIRIVYVRCIMPCYVHENSLYPIASCAKLKVLHLARLYVQSGTSTKFALSKITQKCGELRELYVNYVNGLKRNDFFLNENIKIFNGNLRLTELHSRFLNKLRRCKNLEKIYFDSIRIKECDYNLLADVLRKLKNLNAIVIRPEKRGRVLKEWEKLRNERLLPIFKSIQNERPAFFYALQPSANVPVAHLDSLYHFKIDNYYF